MKKRKAFAFRDFDECRILTRPYFKDFGYTNLTDEEILQSLKASDSDSIDDLESKVRTLKDLHQRALKFKSFIDRYAHRIAKYNQLTKKQVSTGDFLLAVMAVSELLGKLQNQYYETEKATQLAYRKIFTERLRKYRQLAGLTQTELGELVQVSQRGISGYEINARDLPIHTLMRILRVLDISADRLLKLG